MRSEEQLDLGTMERVGKQIALLLRLYEAELASDPTSRATLTGLRKLCPSSAEDSAPAYLADINARRCARRSVVFVASRLEYLAQVITASWDSLQVNRTVAAHAP